MKVRLIMSLVTYHRTFPWRWEGINTLGVFEVDEDAPAIVRKDVPVADIPMYTSTMIQILQGYENRVLRTSHY